jgi:DNA processing protein
MGGMVGDMSSLKYWIWLATRTGVGSARAKRLIDFFGSPENVYYAKDRDYFDVEGIKHADIHWLMQKELDTANKILSSCEEIGCRAIAYQDPNYPDRLRNIYDPPMVFYVKGNLPNIDDIPVVGVVGTRSCTPYGILTAENVCYKLSENGIVVVTGLARGVDTAATRGALRGGGNTIGVIGSGLDIVYPPENKSMYADVIGAGAIISEYPPGTPAVRQNFPARNRIISGISLGVAVIEAPKKSGALITAARALEQGRDVFALPGNVDAFTCEGSNKLLREGAIPFMSADDIIDEYTGLYPGNINSSEKPAQKSIDNTTKVEYIDLGNQLDKLDGDEKAIVEAIGTSSVHVDDIIHNTGFPVQKVLAALTILELGEYIKRDINGNWEIR